jgi:DNA-binding transcriptional ArsR family regulator
VAAAQGDSHEAERMLGEARSLLKPDSKRELAPLALELAKRALAGGTPDAFAKAPAALQLCVESSQQELVAIAAGVLALATQPRSASPCIPPSPALILNHMVQYSGPRLDASFAALSDATRRGVLEQLGRAEASITDLAEKFHMTLTGMKKHVGVLERAGLVTTEKVGRVRTCKLSSRQLEEETAWIERYRQLWAARFDALDKVVEELRRKEEVDGRKKRE